MQINDRVRTKTATEGGPPRFSVGRVIKLEPDHVQIRFEHTVTWLPNTAVEPADALGARVQDVFSYAVEGYCSEELAEMTGDILKLCGVQP